MAHLDLDVESFPQSHPDINSLLLLEHARTALAQHGNSPAHVEVHWRQQVLRAQVNFKAPDPRSAMTLQRPAFIEYGAVVIAGLVLNATEKLRITRVAPRGSRVDYFIGLQPDDPKGILEVGGTDEGSLAGLRSQKRAQLRESFYVGPPFSFTGYISVTRFAPPAASALEQVTIYSPEGT